MKARTTARAAHPALLVLTVVLTAALSACAGDGQSETHADPGACKIAMREQLRDAIAAGATATPTAPPSQCDGVDAGTLQKYSGELMADQVSDALDGPLPQATATTGVTSECRAWLTAELRRTGGGVDFTEGRKICGDLPEDELSQALQDVANSLLTAAPTRTP
ncbi:hypothetical protein [Streptomyces sp. NPDC020489]|uniref:hypothetical protein n=1 Tax=Streptomyces sp. NPDC020489 TaxID=3365077 RepID=UPI0037B21038